MKISKARGQLATDVEPDYRDLCLTSFVLYLSFVMCILLKYGTDFFALGT